MSEEAWSAVCQTEERSTCHQQVSQAHRCLCHVARTGAPILRCVRWMGCFETIPNIPHISTIHWQRARQRGNRGFPPTSQHYIASTNLPHQLQNHCFPELSGQPVPAAAGNCGLRTASRHYVSCPTSLWRRKANLVTAPANGIRNPAFDPAAENIFRPPIMHLLFNRKRATKHYKPGSSIGRRVSIDWLMEFLSSKRNNGGRFAVFNSNFCSENELAMVLRSVALRQYPKACRARTNSAAKCALSEFLHD